jgi:hypothetical protein
MRTDPSSSGLPKPGKHATQPRGHAFERMLADPESLAVTEP